VWRRFAQSAVCQVTVAPTWRPLELTEEMCEWGRANGLAPPDRDAGFNALRIPVCRTTRSRRVKGGGFQDGFIGWDDDGKFIEKDETYDVNATCFRVVLVVDFFSHGNGSMMCCRHEWNGLAANLGPLPH